MPTFLGIVRRQTLATMTTMTTMTTHDVDAQVNSDSRLSCLLTRDLFIQNYLKKALIRAVMEVQRFKLARLYLDVGRVFNGLEYARYENHK